MMMRKLTSSFSLTSVLPPPSFPARSSWLEARLSPPFSPDHDYDDDDYVDYDDYDDYDEYDDYDDYDGYDDYDDFDDYNLYDE